MLDLIKFNDPLFNIATVLVAGIIGGELFARLRLPKVTGWIATGILMRSLALPGLGTIDELNNFKPCLLYTSPSPRDRQKSRMPSSA